MFALIVRNDHVGHLHVTPHAFERWQERSTPADDLRMHLKVAHPFGVQHGSHLLLASGLWVFTVVPRDVGRVVTTTLTRDQAVTNMQTFFRSTRGRRNQ